MGASSQFAGLSGAPLGRKRPIWILAIHLSKDPPPIHPGASCAPAKAGATVSTRAASMPDTSSACLQSVSSFEALSWVQ